MDILCINPNNSLPRNGRCPRLWGQCVSFTIPWPLSTLTPHSEPADSHTLHARPRNQTTTQTQNPLAFPDHPLYYPHS